jgi:uncharacterized protein YjbI with pentapeptide repeats
VGGMAEGKGTNTAEQEKEPGKRPPWWKRLWARTGFGDKTLWDLLQVLIVPLVLVGIGLVFEMQQTEREQRRAEVERELAERRAQDEALQAYLDQMTQLILDRKLLKAEVGDPVYTLAQARTSTIITRLDSAHNRSVTRFLTDSGLSGDERLAGEVSVLRGIELDGAHLRGADLREASLYGADLHVADLTQASLHNADLHNADLRYADLTSADLTDADLSNADLHYADLSPDRHRNFPGAFLTDADLSNAYLVNARGITNEELEQQTSQLEGATMPNGQKYEDWLKDR